MNQNACIKLRIGRRLAVSLALMLGVVCAAYAAGATGLQRRIVQPAPLVLPAQGEAALPIEQKILPSHRHNPALAGLPSIPKPAGAPRRAPAARISAADVPEVELYVSILEDNKGTTMGLYSIPSTGGEFTRHTYGPFAQNGGVYQDGYYFYSFADYYMGYKVYYSFLYDGNQKHWPSVAGGEQNNALLCADAIANNPVNNQAYGCFYTANGTGHELGVIDIHNFSRTTICKLSQGWNAAGFTSDGTLYAILQDGNLAKVNLTTGAYDVVGATGLPTGGPTSGTIDYRSDTFYYATNADGDHAVYAIDLATAAPVKLFDIPYEAKLGGMFIKYPNIEATAPSAVSNLALNFTDGALDGAVEFDAPVATFGGTPLEGALTYEVAVNGSVLASGNCTPGAHTSAPVSLNAPGQYSFEVTVKSDAGASDPVKKSRWIGNDNPAAVAGVSLTIDNNSVATLTWEPVTAGEHGGYLNLPALGYSVRRMPEGVDVATNLKATTFTETLELTGAMAIYYEVRAVCGGNTSEPAVSNTVAVSNIVPPYSETFDNANSLATFTVIDANGDGKTWTFNFDKVQVGFNSTLAMDDWLITSPITLQQGKNYDLTIDVRAHNEEYVPERFEVMLGAEPTAEAMTTTVIAPTDVAKKTYTRYAGRIRVDASGKYYVGIHGISPADKYYIYVDNLAIGAPYDGETPGEVTDFAITPDYDGRVRGTVSFCAPTKSITGSALSGTMDITVSRNDHVVHTFGGIAPGAQCSFEDSASEIGDYRYTIVASNSEGKGAVMAATGRLGVNLAPAPTNVKIFETEEGTVKMTWTSPTEDINGFPLNPEAIHYAILDKSGQVAIAEDLKATEYTLEVLERGSGAQSFVYYYILPQTAAGVNYNDYVYTDQIPVGTPYSYPFAESFAGGSAQKAWAITRLEATSGSWGIGPSSQQPVAYPQDADGGLSAFMPTKIGDEALIHSGKITIPASAASPALSFWYYGVSGAKDRLDVMVHSTTGNGFETIASLTVDRDGDGWHRVVCPLTDYKGQTIRIGLYGVCVSYTTLIVIDNIKVTDVMENNLRVESISAPARLTAGMPGTFTALASNLGLDQAQEVTFYLKRDGRVVATQSVDAFPADTQLTVKFTDTPDVFSSDRVSYTATVEWEGDAVASDNESAPLAVKLSAPALPRVTDLDGAGDGTNVSLTWSAPAAAQPGEPMLESMEHATPFAIDELEGWTFVDADGKNTYAIEGVTFPNNGKPMAYIVMDSERQGLQSEFAALSGSRLLVSFSNTDGSACDNWAISPLLSGKPQTISFSARAQTTAYGAEAFEFLYSLTDTNPDSFVKAGEDRRVVKEWKEYNFDVPQGAKYFAIRCVSEDCFAFMVDDILFTPANVPQQAEPLGYRVYRDRELLDAADLAEPGYTDTRAEATAHSYHVTALYPHGESAPSNEVRLSTSALQAILAGTATVYARPGEIWCANASGKAITVAAADGTLLFNTASARDGIICHAAPGIYIVALDGQSTKLLVP